MSAVFPFVTWHWAVADRCHPAARALADRHYSRQTPGATEFLPPGRRLVLLTHDQLSVWGAVENLDPAGDARWRVTIFRREGGARASDLVVEATARTLAYWCSHYGGPPAVPLQTEVDPSKTRRKRDPGRCFLRAGWTVVGERRGLVILQAPGMGGGR